MAISLDMSNYRADYMISDAAIPQRVEAQTEKEQTTQFAQLLKDCGEVDVNPVQETAAPESIDPGTVENAEQMAVGDDIYDDPMELARKILKGEIDLDDIPADKFTLELVKALIIVAKTEDLDEDDEEEGEEEKDFFDPTKNEATDELQVTMLDQLLAVLYKFIDAYTDTRYDDGKGEVIGGIEELLADFPEISELFDQLEQNKDDADNSPLMEHIMRMRAEQTAVPEVSEEQAANVDTFVKSDEIPPEVKTESPQQSEFAKETSKAVGEENVKILDEAAKNGELGKPEVKQTVQTTQKVSQIPEEEQPEVKNVPEMPVRTDEVSDRAKAISEELEMLRNARLGKTVKQPVEETAAEEKQSVPVQAANPLETESPLVFAGRDGSEITVRPADVAAQAAKLVEKAVTENVEQTEYSLVLNPEELGRITVKLVKATDGAVSVTIAAENARTQRILDQNSEIMQSNLRDTGIRLENWQVVRESQQETLAQDYNGSSKNPYYRDDKPQQDDDEEGKSFAEIIAAM